MGEAAPAGWLGVGRPVGPPGGAGALARPNFTDSQYPNQAKGDRQVPALPPYITPPGLAYRPDVPEASRWPPLAAVYTSALGGE